MGEKKNFFFNNEPKLNLKYLNLVEILTKHKFLCIFGKK